MAKHEASLAAIEEEIKTAKASFEEDLLKIESKMSQNPDSLMRDEDLIHEDDEENEETENKPRSVLKICFQSGNVWPLSQPVHSDAFCLFLVHWGLDKPLLKIQGGHII